MKLYKAKNISPIFLLNKIYQKFCYNLPKARLARKIFNSRILQVKSLEAAIIEKIYNDSEFAILNGPFAGMKYIAKSNGSALLPKLIGSYEEPIHAWINEIVNLSNYGAIIDVGCAEGYYAIGLAVKLSNVKIYAYDIDRVALDNAKKLASINNVSDQIVFKSNFNIGEMRNILSEHKNNRKLVFMDVEGEEINLLNPLLLPDILEFDIIVELHDCFVKGITERVSQFLGKTHILSIVYDYPGRRSVYTWNAQDFNYDEIPVLIDELRPPLMSWMYAKKL